MNRSKAEIMITKFLANATTVKYGYVSVAVKIHDGRITQVTYSTTENNQEKEPKQEENNIS